MSDNNVSPTSQTATTTPAPVLAGAKAPKHKGLSIFNRIALVLLLVLVVTSGVLFALAAQRMQAQKAAEAEAESVREQTAALVAPQWCAKVTPENIADMEAIYDEYFDASYRVQEAIEKACNKRVEIAEMIDTFPADKSFKTDPSCVLDAAGTSVSCSAEISVISDTLKSKLATYSATNLTLNLWYDDQQFVFGTPDHTVENVATVTMVNGGTVSVEFSAPYDSSWGSNYGVEVASFFPNE